MSATPAATGTRSPRTPRRRRRPVTQVDKRNELGAGGTPTIVVGDCNPFASGGASEGSFESNLADRGIPLVYVGTGAFGGYGYLDKIFATTEWTKIDASDRGTGGSDHPAISASLRL